MRDVPAEKAGSSDDEAEASEASDVVAAVALCTEEVRLLHARFTEESRRCRMLNNSLLDLKVRTPRALWTTPTGSQNPQPEHQRDRGFAQLRLTLTGNWALRKGPRSCNSGFPLYHA